MQQAETSDCVAFLREVGILQQHICAELDRLRLSLRDFEVLQCLVAGPLTHSAIGDQLNTYNAVVCRCLGRLSEQG